MKTTINILRYMSYLRVEKTLLTEDWRDTRSPMNEGPRKWTDSIPSRTSSERARRLLIVMVGRHGGGGRWGRGRGEDRERTGRGRGEEGVREQGSKEEVGRRREKEEERGRRRDEGDCIDVQGSTLVTI